MAKRRTILGIAAGAATAVGVPVIISSLRSQASAATGLPLTVVNDSGAYPNDAIWLYVVGTSADGQQGYLKDGTFKPCSMADNGADGYADLSIPLSSSGATTLTLPSMSGRVYVSMGSKLKFMV